MPDNWCLIFSDGTGQRGVRAETRDYGAGIELPTNTNVYQMYEASLGKPYLDAFYDPGLGAPAEGEFAWTRTLRNLWAKGTGWGITDNITDCYEAVMLRWRPGVKIALFGFSRGAYTARCVGGVLGTCGVAVSDAGAPISRDKTGPGAARRRKIADEAVAAYKIGDLAKRQAAGAAFARKYGAAPVMPDVIGVFDTVESLGLPGVLDVVNPWKQQFHDTVLSDRVPVGLHALSIDENRKEFLPVPWEDETPEGRAAGQIIEQVWFPGVHSDIGGGYADDRRLADLTLDWMLSRLRDAAHLHIPLTVTVRDNLLGAQHNERSGMGKFWLPALREVPGKAIDNGALCKDIEKRFGDGGLTYRPEPLRLHPRVKDFYRTSLRRL